MKQIYESEVLYQLMERDGFNIPSSVPPYESEIKAYLINQVKQAYPKLTDYEAEWLLYNYTKHLPAEFPISSVTNATSATFENVVPFAYQSAILKGQTVVNISPLNGEITIAPSSVQYLVSPFIKSNTTFTISFNCLSVPTTGFIEIRQILDNTQLKSENINVVQGYNRFKLTTVNKELNTLRIKNDSTSETDFVFNNLMIIEGDYTNQDISYFEGMQSVQMPVLTTSNEDGTKTNILSASEDATLRGIGKVRDELDLLTGDVIQNVSEFVLDGNYSKMNIVSQSRDTGFIKLRVYDIPDMVITNLANSVDMMICDKFNHESLSYAITDLGGNPFTSGSPTQEYIVKHNNGNEVVIALSKDKAIDLESAKTWLQSNKVKLVYQRQEKSIKTVDLTTVNEKGETTHFMPLEGTMNVQSSGEIIQPTFDMAVPIEATTQNLASFIDLETEE